MPNLSVLQLTSLWPPTTAPAAANDRGLLGQLLRHLGRSSIQADIEDEA
jgi:hypothetical protein